MNKHDAMTGLRGTTRILQKNAKKAQKEVVRLRQIRNRYLADLEELLGQEGFTDSVAHLFPAVWAEIVKDPKALAKWRRRRTERRDTIEYLRRELQVTAQLMTDLQFVVAGAAFAVEHGF